jgi:hypothetical protein
VPEDDDDEIIEDLTEEEEAEVQQYIKNEFAPKSEKIEKIEKVERIEKSSIGVTTQDIISRSGRPAPKNIVYDKLRYDRNKSEQRPYA